MSGKLNGKMALVTAAGQGIGRATAIAFADERAAVVATDINSEALADSDTSEPTYEYGAWMCLTPRRSKGREKPGPWMRIAISATCRALCPISQDNPCSQKYQGS